jgi:hypothetical protein
MSTYLLLRDNKQSGPYTLDEIKAKGFKKYDLVWVEAKSAAWRYPGELPELKLFCPVIEEQPFDRFFKKPQGEMQSTNVSQPAFKKAEATKSEATPQPIVEVEYKQTVAEPAYKKVYVVLPAKKPAPVPAQETFSYQQINKEPIKKEEPKPVLNDYLFAKKETEVQPQQNIKQKYAERRALPTNVNTYRQYMQPAILVASVLALLGAGIFIGLSIKGNSNPATRTDANQKQVAFITKPDAQNVSVPVSSAAPATQKPAAVNNQEKNKNSAQINTAASEKKPLTSEDIEAQKINTTKDNLALLSPKKTLKQEPKADSNSYMPSASHRVATHRTDAINEKELLITNISNLISVSANKYRVGAFGGIYEVQLTVSNKSIYPLDLVMIEVQYLQANKKIFKKENVYFRNIRGGESMMLDAPESSRGIKIEYKVALINSKDPAISYSGT